MKRIKYFIAWFNLRVGWVFTNPRKLEHMGKIFTKEYEKAKSELNGRDTNFPI